MTQLFPYYSTSKKGAFFLQKLNKNHDWHLMINSSITLEIFTSSISLCQISLKNGHLKRWETQFESYSKPREEQVPQIQSKLRNDVKWNLRRSWWRPIHLFRTFKCFMSLKKVWNLWNEWILFHKKQNRYKPKALQLEYSHNFTNQNNLWHWC